jgi:hypothetical protein
MRRQGPGGDTAVAERFFETGKTAMICLEDLETHEQAQPAGLD